MSAVDLRIIMFGDNLYGLHTGRSPSLKAERQKKGLIYNRVLKKQHLFLAQAQLAPEHAKTH